MPRPHAPHAATTKTQVAPGQRSGESTYALKRRLESHRVADRWLGVDLVNNVPVLLYQVDPQRLPLSRADVREALDLSQTVPIPHTLPLELMDSREFAGLWLASPYAGSTDGIVTLGALLSSKDGGQMECCEARRAVKQLLTGLCRSHSLEVGHGQIRIDDVLIDRRGRTFVELFGLESFAFGSTRPDPRAEVRSVAEIGYELITGIPASANLDDGFRMRRDLSKAWRKWLRHGLGEPGFPSARAALSELPGPDGKPPRS